MSKQGEGFKKLVIFFASYLFLTGFSSAILPAYFLKQGFSFQDMLFANIFSYLAAIITISGLRKMNARLSWRLALVAVLVSIILLINIHDRTRLFAAKFISGMTYFFFYIFYNTAHFEQTPKENTGRSSALMFSVGPAVNVVVPLIAGVLGQININLIWVITGILFVGNFILVGKQKDFTIKYSLKKALREIAATRVFIFIEGVWESLLFAIIPVYTLFFIKTPLSYGTFGAYLALVGAAANLLLGKLTDKKQKRAVFLYPVTAVMAAVTVLFSFATKDLGFWLAASGIISFIMPLFWNLSTALVVDTHQNLRSAIPAREFVLATGRILGVTLAFISFLVEPTPKYIFYILAGVILLFPAVLFWNSRIKKNFSYL